MQWRPLKSVLRGIHVHNKCNSLVERINATSCRTCKKRIYFSFKMLFSYRWQASHSRSHTVYTVYTQRVRRTEVWNFARVPIYTLPWRCDRSVLYATLALLWARLWVCNDLTRTIPLINSVRLTSLYFCLKIQVIQDAVPTTKSRTPNLGVIERSCDCELFGTAPNSCSRENSEVNVLWDQEVLDSIFPGVWVYSDLVRPGFENYMTVVSPCLSSRVKRCNDNA